MALLLEKLYEKYDYVIEDLSDHRVKSFFLMSSPFPTMFIVGLYLYFVLKLGPRIMKNRPPFDLEKILVVYNLIQVVTCAFLVLESGVYVLSRYSYTCEPVDYSNDEFAVFITRRSWMYFMLKVIDLLDTVFFILRKKFNQVSFLHVYHHSLMAILGWIGVKYIPGGHTVVFGLVNCTVHAVMYFYYLLSAWDKEYKKNVWWKRHITHMQLAQFVILIVYYGQILFQPNCNYPKLVGWLAVTQNVVMIILFSNFYIKAYIKPQKKIKTENNCSSVNGKNAINNCSKKSL